jgi:hypothetical protein
MALDSEMVNDLYSQLPPPESENQPISEPPPNFDGEVESILDPAKWIDPWGEPYTLANAFKPRSPIEYLIQGLFKKPSLNMIYGAPGGLKTLLVQSLCLSVASGLPWFLEAPWKPGGPIFTTKQAPSMFIDFDNGPEEMHERIEALARTVNLDTKSIPFYYYSFPEAGFDACNKLHIGELILRIKRLNVGMLWFDNLGVIKGAASENTDEMILVMNNLRYIVVQTGVVLGIIHHQSKSKDYKRRSGESIRGHSSIEGSLDLALLVERDEYGDSLLIKPTKTRGALVYPFGAEFTYTHKQETNDLETARFYSVPCEDKYSDEAIDEIILSCLDGKSFNKSQLTNAVKGRLLDIGLNRIRDRIDRLAMSGKINEKPGERTAKLFELP